MTEKTFSGNSLLVTLCISVWDANRQDRRASNEVAAANNVTDKRLCRLRKSLLPKARVLDVLAAEVRAARNFHYENTHAWLHDGPRILTRANYEPYMTRMRGFKTDFDTAVFNLIAEYESLKHQAKGVLGSLFNPDDYPARDTLLQKYNFDTMLQPLPLASSLLDLGLDDAETDIIRQKLERDMADTFGRANRRLWDELFGKVEKLYTKLADEQAYVMEETIDAVRKLAELLPRINITQDPNLAVVAGNLTRGLAGVTADAVKTNPSVRLAAMSEVRLVYHVIQSLRAAPVSGLARVAD